MICNGVYSCCLGVHPVSTPKSGVSMLGSGVFVPIDTSVHGASLALQGLRPILVMRSTYVWVGHGVKASECVCECAGGGE